MKPSAQWIEEDIHGLLPDDSEAVKGLLEFLSLLLENQGGHGLIPFKGSFAFQGLIKEGVWWVPGYPERSLLQESLAERKIHSGIRLKNNLGVLEDLQEHAAS